MLFHETEVSSVAVGTCTISVRSFAWNGRMGVPSDCKENVPETVQDTGRETLVGGTRQVCISVLTPAFLLKPVLRTFSVHMSRSNAPDLVKLLPLLPNLDTLEVLTEDYVEPSLVLSFKLVKLPRVRTLVVDAQAHYLMKCCTHVKRVVIHRRGFDVTYLESIPFIADSLVYLAVCPPVPEIIQGADDLPHFYRWVIQVAG